MAEGMAFSYVFLNVSLSFPCGNRDCLQESAALACQLALGKRGNHCSDKRQNNRKK